MQTPKNVREVDNRQVRTLAGGLCCVSGKEAVNSGEADCSDSVSDAVESALVRAAAAAHNAADAGASDSRGSGQDDGLRRSMRARKNNNNKYW